MTTTAGRPDTGAAGAMMRLGLLASIPVGVVCVLVGLLAAGGSGLWGALVGFALVLAFCSISLLLLGGTARLDPMLTLMIALVLYTTKVIALGIVLLVLSRSGLLDDRLDRTALGVTVIVCTLTWTVVEIMAAIRHREPLYDLGERS